MIYHNGAYIEDDAIFTFQDRLRLGDGVFDTLLIIDGSPLHADLHIKRLLHDANVMGITALPVAHSLHEAVITLIVKNEARTGRYALNTLITRGVAARGLMPSTDTIPSVSMRITPVPDSFAPIDAIIARHTCRNEGSALSRIKSCNYGDNILALIEARNAGANEAIMLNNAGHVTCASAGNIFCCINDQLVTPPLSDGVMDGVTRKLAIEKYNAIERSITQNDLKNAAGIYITNSIKGAMHVSSLDGKTLPEPSIKIEKDFHIKWHSKH